MGFSKPRGDVELGKPSTGVRPQGIPALLVMAALVIGEGGVVLQLFFNVIKEEGAIVTSFLQTVVGTALLWCLVRPNLRVGWALWWRAMAIGGSSVVSLVAAREAMTLVPYGTITCLAFVFGPMAAASFRIVRAGMLRKAWVWPMLAGASVFLLVDGLGMGDILGFALIGLVALAYHVYATVTSGLKRDELNTLATLARLPTVLLLTGMLYFSPEGPGALLDVSAKAWWVLSASGALGVIALLLINKAWAKDMTVTTHASVMPADNGLAMVDGMLAGQYPTPLNWLGAGLIIIAEVGATRARIPDRNKPPAFSRWLDEVLPVRFARLMLMCVMHVRNLRVMRVWNLMRVMRVRKLMRASRVRKLMRVMRVRSKEQPEEG